MNIFRNKKIRKHSRAQSLVEFALILPIFLLVLTGIIEFGYAWFTWSAVSEVARMGIRYAITGQYSNSYCELAGEELGLKTEDFRDGVYDCVVPDRVSGVQIEDYEINTALLQDWARRPSTRDAAIAGGSTGLLHSPSVSGNYMDFIKNPFDKVNTSGQNNFQDDYRGDPTANGYFSISMCSNRSGVSPDNTPRYYQDQTTNNDARFIGVCITDIGDTTTNNSQGRYTDDAGGPGDRVRITVTYNHPLIVPFFNGIWPHLKITATQDAIVEKFRTSRLAGLSQGISGVEDTGTATNTVPPTATATFTVTPTSTVTATHTSTPAPCANANGTGLLGHYYAYEGESDSSTIWTNLLYLNVENVDFNWGNGSPGTGLPVDDFHVRWIGTVYPAYPGEYTFFTRADDGTRLWIDGVRKINNWSDQSPTIKKTTLTLTCGAHDIKLEYYENGGGAVMQLGWYNENLARVQPSHVYVDGAATFVAIPTIYLRPPTGPRTPTSTFATATATRTFTRTLTYTRTNTVRTSTYTNTVPATKTYTRTYTLTYTKTLPATNTYTFTNTVARTNTYTLTATKSRTATPGCAITIAPDLGGGCARTIAP